MTCVGKEEPNNELKKLLKCIFQNFIVRKDHKHCENIWNLIWKRQENDDKKEKWTIKFRVLVIILEGKDYWMHRSNNNRHYGEKKFLWINMNYGINEVDCHCMIDAHIYIALNLFYRIGFIKSK